MAIKHAVEVMQSKLTNKARTITWPQALEALAIECQRANFHGRYKVHITNKKTDKQPRVSWNNIVIHEADNWLDIQK